MHARLKCLRLHVLQQYRLPEHAMGCMQLTYICPGHTHSFLSTQVGEDTLASTVEVDLGAVLTSRHYRIHSVRELSLSAAQYKDEMPARLSWRIEDQNSSVLDNAAGDRQAANPSTHQIRAQNGQSTHTVQQGHILHGQARDCPAGMVHATARGLDVSCARPGSSCPVMHPGVWQHTRPYQPICVPAPKERTATAASRGQQQILGPWAASNPLADQVNGGTAPPQAQGSQYSQTTRHGRHRVCHAAGGLSSAERSREGLQRRRGQAIVELLPMEVS